MMTTDMERLAVKFLVAALGQGRENARAFCQRLPENIHPRLLAAAQAWSQKSCMEASQQFTALMNTNASPISLTPPAPSKKKQVWTPEMRKKQSTIVKRAMAAKKRKARRTPAAQPQAAIAADHVHNAAGF